MSVRLNLAACALSVSLLPAAAFAAIPRTISFQGILATPAGAPKPPGLYNATFRFYTTLTDVSPLWSETKTITVGAEGRFVTYLGDTTPFPASLAFDVPYYLGVQISPDAAEMTPRLALASAPYSLSPGLSLPFSGTLDSASPGLHVTNSGAGNALAAESAGPGITGAALAAHSSSSSGIAILSDTSSTDGNVVLFQNGSGPLIKGFTNGGSTLAFEVQNSGFISSLGGLSATSPNGVAINGTSNGLDSLNTSYGVFGASTVDGGVGVYGAATAGTNANGVSGYGSSNGVMGRTSNSFASGVYGQNDAGGYGAAGRSKTGVGVLGESTSNGQGTGSDGVEGASYVSGKSGVYGHNDAPNGFGVYGAAGGAGGIGVQGAANGFTTSKGVYGASASGTGVFGHTDGSGGVGVFGDSTDGGAYGWLGGRGGVANGPIGVYGQGSGDIFSIAVYGKAGAGLAGRFDGDVFVAGKLSASDKQFLIDDPVDPANRLLAHTSVESSDMMDIYNGNVTTDADGEAVVTLPDWFEALNGDFRYQLTTMGQFAQAMVAQEIRDNRFTIQTDKPNVKVSWQVTGIRHDAYALAHPPQVVIDKSPQERGRYLNPDAFGLPRERSLSSATGQSPVP